MGNRRCYCYTDGAMERVNFWLPPLCTLRRRSSTQPRPFALAFCISLFVHAACYFFLSLSEHGSHPDNAWRVLFSTTTTTVTVKAVDATLHRCCYNLTTLNSIPTWPCGVWKGSCGKSTTEMVSCASWLMGRETTDKATPDPRTSYGRYLD